MYCRITSQCLGVDYMTIQISSCEVLFYKALYDPELGGIEGTIPIIS